jgi:hypothetical protein
MCLQVSEFVKKEVDSRIAPRSVSLGEHSNAVTELFEADEMAAKLKASEFDLESDAGKRKSPSFIILGAQKSGTTSLYEYICQHPLVIKGKVRETHYFDWEWMPKLKTPEQQLDHYLYMKFFSEAELHKHPSLMTGESTPSYLLHSDIVIPRIKSTCPWAQLFVILRNPVDRAFSQYNMCVDSTGTPQHCLSIEGKSFKEVINMELAELDSLGINVS